jgi:flavin reductase (DIM6/NTAB) family NADH-FMN oxidoreductase RutF
MTLAFATSWRWLQVPQYVALGVCPSQEEVSVRLEIAGRTIEVGRNNVVAALRPLTLGVMLDTRALTGPSLPRRCQMSFHSAAHGTLGVIHLRLAQSIDLEPHTFWLFDIVGSRNFCMPWVARPLQDGLERWRTRRYQKRHPFNFQMRHRDLKALFVFYIRPRPVYLVSVEHDAHLNLFPMDLVGPTDSPWFSFALRRSSPAMELMKKAGRFAAAGIDVTFKSIAYDLGQQHKQARIDPATLPFKASLSPEFGLPVPNTALDVREVTVGQAVDVGSHCLFLTKVAKYTRWRIGADVLQLAHVHGSYAELLSSAGRTIVRA